MHLERVNRELVVGGDEHNGRSFSGREGVGYFDAGSAGHLDVEKRDIWPLVANESQGRGPIACFANNGHSRYTLEQPQQAAAGNRFIVCHQHTKRHHGGHRSSRVLRMQFTPRQ
jgi:hypothetical protein